MKPFTRHSVIAFFVCGSVACASAQAVNPSGSTDQTGQAGQSTQSSPADATSGIVGSSAPETGYVDLLAGLAYTDNSQLAAGHHQGDGIGTAGLDADYIRQGNLSVKLLGDLERVEYLRGTYPGQFYGHLFGSALLGKPTDVVQWQLSDRFGEGMTDPLAAPTPQNLQTINDVATGPIVNLHFGLTNRLSLFGLYSRASYQRSPYGFQSYQGGAEFSHQVSGASAVALQGSTQHVDYLNRVAATSYLGGPVTNFNIQEVSFSYQAKFSRLQLLLRTGYTRLDYGVGTPHGTPLYDLEIRRSLTPFSSVFLSGQQSYSTNGASLGTAGDQFALRSGGNLSPGLASPQPAKRRSGSLGWSFDRARTTLSLIGMVQELVYEQTSGVQNHNYRDESLYATLGRRIRPTVSVQLRAQGDIQRYTALHAQRNWETVRFTISKHFMRLAIAFFAERRHQTGSAGESNFVANSYNDDRFGIYFTYDLLGARTMRSSLSGMMNLPGMSNY